jgi:hypothetical protein
MIDLPPFGRTNSKKTCNSSHTTGLQLGCGRVAHMPLGSWSKRRGGSSRGVRCMAEALVAIQHRRRHRCLGRQLGQGRGARTPPGCWYGQHGAPARKAHGAATATLWSPTSRRPAQLLLLSLISHLQTHNLPLCYTCNFTNITII